MALACHLGPVSGLWIICAGNGISHYVHQLIPEGNFISWIKIKPSPCSSNGLVDTMYPELGKAMVCLFEKPGISVDIPLDQTCCGQPAFNSGYRKEAKIAAKRSIEIFESAKVIVNI